MYFPMASDLHDDSKEMSVVFSCFFVVWEVLVNLLAGYR